MSDRAGAWRAAAHPLVDVMVCRFENLHYCLVEGVPVFLDVTRDRYFRLGPAAEGAFLSRTGDVWPQEAKAARLPEAIERPRHSALEHGPQASRGRSAVLSVALSLIRAWQILNWGSFARAIGYVGALEPDRRAGDKVDDLMIESAVAFDRARRLLPANRVCLLDSIALAAFLHRRRRHPRLVIGVTLAPFAAHCWLQAGDWVLNESVDHAASFTPILVV